MSFKTNSIGEHVCCRLLLENNNDLVVGVVYRSDNHGLNMDTNEAARQLIRVTAKFFTYGRFTYPDIDWENNDGVGPNSRMFLECLEDGFFYATRQRTYTGSGVLGLDHLQRTRTGRRSRDIRAFRKG